MKCLNKNLALGLQYSLCSKKRILWKVQSRNLEDPVTKENKVVQASSILKVFIWKRTVQVMFFLCVCVCVKIAISHS